MTPEAVALVAFTSVLAGLLSRRPRRLEGGPLGRSKDGAVGVPEPVLLSCVVVFASAIWLGSPTVAVGGPWALWAIRRQSRTARRRARRRSLDRQLIDAVDATILHLRSGRPLAVAFQLALADEAGSALGLLSESFVDHTRSGARFDESLDQLASTSVEPGLRLLAATVSTLSTSGGTAVSSLERLNDTLRARSSAANEAHAQAAQATASAVVMASLPLLFGCVVALIEPQLADFYLRNPVGTACVIASATLTTVGWLWMERVIDA